MKSSIRLVTSKNGKIRMDRMAKPTAALSEILEIAECEVFGGYADYSMVEVDGKVYAEYEA